MESESESHKETSIFIHNHNSNVQKEDKASHTATYQANNRRHINFLNLIAQPHRLYPSTYSILKTKTHIANSKNKLITFNTNKERRRRRRRRKMNTKCYTTTYYISLTSNALRFLTTMSNMCIDLNLLKSLGREIKWTVERLWNWRRSGSS